MAWAGVSPWEQVARLGGDEIPAVIRNVGEKFCYKTGERGQSLRGRCLMLATAYRAQRNTVLTQIDTRTSSLTNCIKQKKSKYSTSFFSLFGTNSKAYVGLF